MQETYTQKAKTICEKYGEGKWPKLENCGMHYYICHHKLTFPVEFSCDSKQTDRPRCYQKSSDQCKYCKRTKDDPPSEHFDCQRDVKDLLKHY